jgi:hypothetical protein
MFRGKGSVVVRVEGFWVLIVVILLIQLAMVQRVGGGKKRSVLCKAPEGLRGST